MKIRVDLSRKDRIVMIGEVGYGKTVKRFTAVSQVETNQKDAVAKCYAQLIEKKSDYFSNL